MIFNGREFEEHSNEYCYLVFLSSITYSSSPISPLQPRIEYIELPLCPLCIERLDVSTSGVTGVLRTEVNNLGRGRWTDVGIRCKVCSILAMSEKQNFVCESCENNTELWVCLICGSIGCGRYKEAHSEKHYQKTRHTLTVDIASQCVWDYEIDNYVHRLLHCGRELLILDAEFNQVPKENVERMITEYNHLINSQLEQQRIMFEQKVENVLAARSSLLHEEIKKKKVENEYLKKRVSKIKAQRRKKENKEAQLKALREENAILEEVNKSLSDYSPEQAEPIFEDKKTKGVYLKLQRLRAELAGLINTFQ